jgi:hypothetical protein
MRRDDRRGQRGSALPETAITISVVLFLMLGSIRVALLGYLQLSADGAAYLASHEYTLQNIQTQIQGSSNITPALAAATAFPAIAASQITAAPMSPPPSATYPPINNLTQNLTQSSREGGVTGVRPVEYGVTVNPPGAVSLNPYGAGATIAVQGVAVEPLMQTTNSIWNLDNNAIDTPSVTGYFSDPGNTPPFMVGFHELFHCDWDNQNNQLYTSGSNLGGCETGGHNGNNAEFFSLGMADYLDSKNWDNATGANETSVPNGVFCDLTLHQQVYVHLLSSTFPSTYPSGIRSNSTTYDIDNLATSAPLYLLYGNSNGQNTGDHWDYENPAGYPSPGQVGQYPFYPGVASSNDGVSQGCVD